LITTNNFSPIRLYEFGKVVWAKNNEIQTTTVRGLAGAGGGEDDNALPDGDRLPVVPRDLGACELYPQSIKQTDDS